MKYTKLPYTPSTIDSALSISPQGRIGLTKVFISINRIESSSRAFLYLDDSRTSMAIDFTDADDDTAYPIAFTQQSGGFINAKKFFQQAHIELEGLGGRYSYKQMPAKSIGLTGGKQEVLVVDLEHPVKTGVKVEID